MTFNPNSLAVFLINASMVGLGLIIAIYAISSPTISTILSRRRLKLERLIKKRDELFILMEGHKSDEKITSDYSQIQKQIRLIRKVPFHLDFGYSLAASSFALSLLIPLATVLSSSTQSNLFDNLGLVYFLVGVFSMVSLWFATLSDFRTHIKEEFDKISDESASEEKSNKVLMKQWKADNEQIIAKLR